MAKRGSSTEKLETAERRSRVLELRKAGKPWRKIAATLEAEHGAERLPKGWDHRYASKDFRRELKALRSENAEAAEDIRDLEIERLNAMLAGLWPAATTGEEKSVHAVVRIMERRAKLLGIDAPEQIEGAVTMLQDEKFVQLRTLIMDVLKDAPEKRAEMARRLAEADVNE